MMHRSPMGIRPTPKKFIAPKVVRMLREGPAHFQGDPQFLGEDAGVTTEQARRVREVMLREFSTWLESWIVPELERLHGDRIPKPVSTAEVAAIADKPMTVFNPEGKAVLTYGDVLRPAMEITDPDDAKQYLAAYVAHMQKNLDAEPARADGMTAEQICKVNLGYFAGYYSNDTRARVERLFDCAHPVFGKAAGAVPTSAQALQAGLELAKGAQS